MSESCVHVENNIQILTTNSKKKAEQLQFYNVKLSHIRLVNPLLSDFVSNL